MLYHSTRGKEKNYTSKEAILKGLCQDGGLFVSDGLLQTSLDLSGLETLTYEELLRRVFTALLTDYSEEELEQCIRNAYRGKFETEQLTPVTQIGDKYLLELYHGPTCAFKDMALCMLPQLMSVACKDSGKKVMILTATSGDTGKAALSGFAGAENIGILVFYPSGKVSDIQYLQMATQQGNNVYVAGVEGNFDHCQTGVKKIFEEDSEEALSRYQVLLSSANSINVGRLVPQIVYYFDSYRQLLKNGSITRGEKVNFCVPTGNFGDILAGYYAKLLGLPVNKLIIASNENNVLYDFFCTGIYNRNRSFIKTISPSMDILVSSNLERLLYYASGCDCEAVRSMMKDLSEKGTFQVSESVMAAIRESFLCGYASNEQSKEAIRTAYEKDGRLIDPHTACGYWVCSNMNLPEKTVILSTASPFKFAADVYRSLFSEELSGDGFLYMEKLSEKTGVRMPEALSNLRSLPVLHDGVVPIEGMKDFVFNSIEKLVRSEND